MLYGATIENASLKNFDYLIHYSNFILLGVFILFYLIFKHLIKVFNSRFKNEKKPYSNADELEINCNLSIMIVSIQNNKDIKKDALEYLSYFEKRGEIPDLKILNELIEMSIRFHHFKIIKKFYEIISDELSSHSIDISTYQILFKALTSEIKRSKYSYPSPYEEKDLDNIIKVYRQDMRKRQLQFNLCIFNHIFKSYFETGNLEKMWKYYLELKQNNLEVEFPTISILIEAFKNHNPENNNNNNILEKTLELIQDLKERKNSSHYNFLAELYNLVISSCFKIKKGDLVEKYIKEMKMFALNMSLHTYSILIVEYSKMNQIDKALIYFNELRLKFSKPDRYLYENLLDSAYRCNRFDIMNELYDKAKNEKILISENIKTNLIRLNIKHKNYIKSFEIFDTVSSKVLLTIGIDLINLILEAYIETGLNIKVFLLYDKVQRKSEDVGSNLKPNITTHILVIKAYTLVGRIDDARQLYLMVKEQANLNINVFNSIADSFAQVNEIDPTLTIIKEIKQCGYAKDLNTYSVLMKLYSNGLNEEKCISTFDEILRENIKPNLSIYSSLMHLFIKKNKIIQAIGIYTDIKLNKSGMDQSTYNSIINACIHHQKIQNAFQILIDASNTQTTLAIDTYTNFLDALIQNNNMKGSDKRNFTQILTKIMRDSNVFFSNEICDQLKKIESYSVLE